MRKILWTGAILLGTGSAWAQSSTLGVNVLRNDAATGLPVCWRFDAHAGPEQAGFASWLRQELHLSPQADFVAYREDAGMPGERVIRYQETMNGVPVQGAVWVARVQEGRVVSANGAHYPVQPAAATLTEAEGFDRARQAMPAQVYSWEAQQQPRPQGILMYVPVQGKPAAGFRLAWRYDLHSWQPLQREFISIDAQTGEIVHRISRIHTTDVPSTAQTYYSGLRNITSDFVGGTTHHLVDNARKVETWDMRGSMDYALAQHHVSNSPAWTLPGYKAAALDAHWGAEMTYDYYIQKHNRDSYDNAGSPLISYTSFGVGFVNAFWDGTSMTYGDGGQGYGPFTALDVCGHEFSHGTTEYSANLVYQDEPGALNESFSDIFGESIEYYARPGAHSWIIGEEVTQGGLRDMSNPHSFTDPRCYQGIYWMTGPGDNGGVHTNSGVQNWWYYLLVEGGNGLNDFSQNYLVSGLGLDTAAAIAYRTLTTYLVPNSEYEDAWFYSLQAAEDLYGACSRPYQQTMNAWFACGLGSPFGATLTSAFDAETSVHCAVPATVNFRNNASGAVSYQWNFGDGTTSTQAHPTHTYTQYGSYTVTLIVSACDGSRDTLIRNAYIQIDPALPCAVIMETSGYLPTQTSCTGTIKDSGADGNYMNNVSSFVTIAPAGAGQVRLEFQSFNFAGAGDYVAIYDGPSVASPLIGNFGGTTLPMGGVITSTGPAITVGERTNALNNASGFEASWTCLAPVHTADPVRQEPPAFYPNPAQSVLHVEGRGWTGGTVAVYDLMGQQIRAVELQQETEIQLADLAAGMYLIRFTQGAEVLTKRFEILR